MDTLKIIKALDLGEDATEAQVLERIADIKRDRDERSVAETIAAGEHEQVALHDDGTVTVTLVYPIKFGTAVVDELKFSRPKGKHMRKMDAVDGVLAKQLALFAALSGLSTKELDELDAVDFNVCMAVTAFFSLQRRRTGARS